MTDRQVIPLEDAHIVSTRQLGRFAVSLFLLGVLAGSVATTALLIHAAAR